MSRHLLQIEQIAEGETQRAYADQLIARLAERNPARAHRVQALRNDPEIITHVAREALAQAARASGCELRDEYQNAVARYHESDSGRPQRGTCIGVLARGEVQLGIAIDGDQLYRFWNANSAASAELRNLQDAWQRAYTAQSLEASLQLLSGNVPQRHELEDGEVLQLLAALRPREVA